MNKLSLAGFALAALLAGCGYVQRHQAPVIQDTPHSYKTSAQLSEFRNEAWWLAFDDATLNGLIEEAIAGNPSMEATLARLQQFRAQSRATRASLFPTVSAQGSYQDGEREFGSFGALDLDYFDVSVSAQYEVDLWGKLSARRRAAFGDLLASEHETRAALLTVTAQISRTYYLVLDLREQQQLISQTITSNQNAFELVTTRYALGLVTSLDVYQAESNLAQSRAQKASVDASLTTAEHLLSILLGRYPQTELFQRLEGLPATVRDVGAGVPSELLARRPDIQAARARLFAADARWASANAALLPSFTLSGTYGNLDEDLADALDPDNLLWNLVAGVTAPIFQGGRIVGEAQRSEAVFQEAAANYKTVVLNAFREVEDALARGDKLRERIVQLEKQTAAAGNSLRVAEDQYEQGIIGYLQVLIAQNSYYAAQSALITARRELLHNRIDLAAALGGSWTDDVLRARDSRTKLHADNNSPEN